MGIHKNRKTIAAFLPYLSGFYLSSITAELRKQAALRKIDLILVMTNGLGQYHLPVALDYIDGAYIVLNSVSDTFIKTLDEKKIPIISNVSTYKNKNIEVISSNHADGIKKIYKHLHEQGHRKIGFIGDFSIRDFERRHNALLRCYEQHNEEFYSEWLFAVSNPSILGGIEAGTEFIRRERPCSAVICGSDLIAIGFDQTLRKSGLTIPEDVAIVGVDNTRLGKASQFSLTTLDQRLDRLVEKTLDRFEQRFQGAPFQETHNPINQSLIIRFSSGSNSTSHSGYDTPDNPRPFNPMQDDEEINLAMSLAGMGYEWLINLSKLWGPFLKWGCLAHWNDKRQIEMSSFFSEGDELESALLNQHVGMNFNPESFPPSSLSHCEIPEPALITLLPITPEGEHWGILAIFDQLTPDLNQDHYNMFNYYLVLMSLFTHSHSLETSINHQEQQARELTEHINIVTNTSHDCLWTWDLDHDVMEWNQPLLDMLGFTTHQEHASYKNMSFLERVHPGDQEYFQQLLMSHLDEEKAFNTKFRIQAKDGQYLWVDVSGESVKDPSGKSRRFIGVFKDITDKVNAQKHIQFMAEHDALTNIANRITLIRLIEFEIENHKGKPFALMILNLNRFKRINETYGHKAGDALLQHLASLLNKLLRKDDVISRFDGDEFAFLCHIKNEQDAINISERILNHLHHSFQYFEDEIPIDGSLGIALYPKDAQQTQELIRKASVAMFRAKSRQLVHAILYNHSMDMDLKDKITMEHHLRQAVDKEELFLELQPIIETCSQRVVGAEVLARWHSDAYGIVPPSTFIPLAEEIGIIKHLGNWILNETFSLVQRWQSLSQFSFKISMNLSAGQLEDPEFAKNACQLVQDLGINPQFLCFELTESAAVYDIDQTREQLNMFAALGAQISLDDFGTGYSSLSLLNDMPLHWVKIDRSFIKGLSDKDLEKGMVKSITEMCHSLGYHVVAEGVETHEQLSIIQKIGCDQIQGYIYSKPVSIVDFENLFIRKNFQMSQI